MEENKISIGLDIGTTKIVAMIGRRNEYGKVQILGVGRSKSFRAPCTVIVDSRVWNEVEL